MPCPGEYFSSLGVLTANPNYRYSGCYGMNPCDDAVDVLRYLDNELSGPELEAFRAHLQSCPTCKVRLEEERAFSSLLHQSRPLYRAPEELRHQVSEMLKQHPAAGGASGIYERLLRILQTPLLNRWPHLPSRGMWVSALVVVSLVLIVPPGGVRRGPAANHQGNTAGGPPNQFRESPSPPNQTPFPPLAPPRASG